MEQFKIEEGKEMVRNFLSFIGENPDREGLLSTPKRVVKMWGELYRGYDKEAEPAVTAFENQKDGLSCNQMIIDKGYFFSQCEHHLVPFFGQYFFSYIPAGKIVGLSKVARLVDYYSAKLQVQERLTKEIVDHFQKLLEPKGIMLVMKGRHLCKEMRGVKKVEGEMVTSEVRGVYENDINARQEFLQLIK